MGDAERTGGGSGCTALTRTQVARPMGRGIQDSASGLGGSWASYLRRKNLETAAHSHTRSCRRKEEDRPSRNVEAPRRHCSGIEISSKEKRTSQSPALSGRGSAPGDRARVRNLHALALGHVRCSGCPCVSCVAAEWSRSHGKHAACS